MSMGSIIFHADESYIQTTRTLPVIGWSAA